MPFDLHRLTLLEGKWVYVWHPQQVCGGNVAQIITSAKAAGVAGLAIKVDNGTYAYADQPLVHELIVNAWAEGLRIAIWGYKYLRWPKAEALASVKMAQRYPGALVYLIDVEREAKGQRKNAEIYIAELRKGLEPLGMPIGLNSYRFPYLHPELPWTILRTGSHIDVPQVYYRNTSPVSNLNASWAEFQRMKPPRDFEPAGDMYFEHGISPGPERVKQFVELCRDDPRFDCAIMWAMDQRESTAAMWNAFSRVAWPVEGMPWTITPPGESVNEGASIPLYAGVVKANALNVRQGPGIDFPPITTLRLGDRVTIWREQSGWGEIAEGRWISLRWINRMAS